MTRAWMNEQIAMWTGRARKNCTTSASQSG